VVRHLDHGGIEICRSAPQRILGASLDVPGQQHPRGPVRQPQNERAIVIRTAVGLARGMEHDDLAERSNEWARTTREIPRRDPAVRERVAQDSEAGVARSPSVRPELTHRQRSHDRGETSVVIVLRVRERDHRQVSDTRTPERRDHDPLPWIGGAPQSPCVDDDRCALRRQAKDGRVALPDVEEADLETRGETSSELLRDP